MREGTLEAIRLSDSLLPVGSYAASYGLEQFVQTGRVGCQDDLTSFLRTHLRQQLGRADLVALRAANGAALDDDVEEIQRADQRLDAVTTAAEFRQSSRAEGERLLALQSDLRDDEVLDEYADRVDAGSSPGAQPVVLGLVTGRVGIDERTGCLVHCHRFVAGLLAVAQRLMSLGHTDAQRILTELHPTIQAAVEASADRSIDEMAPFSPEIDVLSAAHERADRRLFTS